MKTIKSISNAKRRGRDVSSPWLKFGFTFCGVLALASTGALADRGQGSIRAAARAEPAPHAEARPAPAPQAAARPEPSRAQPTRAQPTRSEPPRAQPPLAEPARGQPARPEPARPVPEARPDVHAAPPREAAPARREWDDNDEEAHHFGGFGRGVPARVARGVRVHDLPPSHREIDFDRHRYFLDDVGVYYDLEPDGQYLVIQPPLGVIVPALPDGATAVVFGPTTFYYLDGVFYVPQGGGFAVVNPPPGIVVPVLPSGASQVIVNGSVAFQFNGFIYQPSLQDGVTVYTVTPT